MKWSFQIAEIAGIPVKLHLTFFLVFLIFNNILLALVLFFFVTVHELAHSIVAKSFGIKVREITLYPIGGVASLGGTPKKPLHEFLISLAGPMVNIGVLVILYYPMISILGQETLKGSLIAFLSGYIPFNGAKAVMIWVYWMNFMLAVFNLIPAFPMDGGRILRAILTKSIGLAKATKIAVIIGMGFAIVLGYVAFRSGSIFTMFIALFLFLAASSEEMQVDIKDILTKIRVRDVYKKEFLTVRIDAALSAVLDLMMSTKQEDFPVMDISNENMAGFITRDQVMSGIHENGVQTTVEQVMRRDIAPLNEDQTLDEAQQSMEAQEIKALPVTRNGRLSGIITVYDIGRVYQLISARGK